MAYDEELADRVREVLETLHPGAGLTEKKMFGGLGFMLEGNMAVGVSGQGGLMLRVPPEETERLAAGEHAAPLEMRGRPMSGWLRVSADGVTGEAELREWVEIGVDHVRTMPPK